MAVKDADDTKDTRRRTMLDMSQAAVKKMIAEAKAKGYITYDQLNNVLPPDQVSSEQIEDVMSMLSEMGINVIEEEEAEERGRAADRGGHQASPRGRSRSPATEPRSSTAPTTRCGCICARWARSNCCRARARSPSPSASRPAATR
jgi:RNA polymerase primary sigma factor